MKNPLNIKTINPENLIKVSKDPEIIEEINYIHKPDYKRASIKLYAPNEYWLASKKERANICNGCGAKKGLNVPDTFYGLCVKEACNIHDWMYHFGKTKADKLFADAMFRLNLTILIDEHYENHPSILSGFLTPLRHSRAAKYYFAVAKWGDSAYWLEKHNQFEPLIIQNLKRDLKITFNGKFESYQN